MANGDRGPAPLTRELLQGIIPQGLGGGLVGRLVRGQPFEQAVEGLPLSTVGQGSEPLTPQQRQELDNARRILTEAADPRHRAIAAKVIQRLTGEMPGEAPPGPVPAPVPPGQESPLENLRPPGPNVGPQTAVQNQPLSFPLPPLPPPVQQPGFQQPDFSEVERLRGLAAPTRPEPLTRDEEIQLALMGAAQGALSQPSRRTGRVVGAAGLGLASALAGGRAAERAAEREFNREQAAFQEKQAEFALQKLKLESEFETKNRLIEYQNLQNQRNFEIEQLKRKEPRFQPVGNELLMYYGTPDGKLNVESITISETTDALQRAQGMAQLASALGKGDKDILTIGGVERVFEGLPKELTPALKQAILHVTLSPNDPKVKELRKQAIEEFYGGEAFFQGIAVQRPEEAEAELQARMAWMLLQEQGLNVPPPDLEKMFPERVE